MSAKKALSIVLIVVIAGIVLMGGAIATIVIMFPPAKIAAVVVPEAEKALGRSVKLRKAALSFYPYFGVRLQGLEIANTAREGFSTEPFVKLDEFVLKIKLMPLFKKQLAINTIILKRPWILVETDAAGQWNYGDLAILAKDTSAAPEAKPAAGAAGLPIPLTLDKFAIEQGHVLYNDRKGKMKVDLGQIDQTVDISIDRELKDIKTTGSLIIRNIAFLSKDVPKPMTGLVVTLSHDAGINMVDGVASLKQVKLSLQKIGITLTGTVKNFNADPDLDLAITSDTIGIADLLAEIPPEMVKEIRKTKGTGSLEFVVKLAGTLDKKSGLPQVNGTLKINNGMIQYADLPQSINNLNADMAFTPTNLTINSLGCKLGNNPISIRATIDDFGKPRIDALVDAAVNLDEMKDVIKMPDGNSLGGSFTAKIAAKGIADPADPSKLSINGMIALNNVTSVTPAVARPVIMNGTIGLTSKSILPKLAVKIGASSISLNAELANWIGMAFPDPAKKYARPRLTFTLASPMLNTNEFLAQNQAAVEADKQGAKPPPADTNALLLAGPLPGIDMIGTVTTTRLIYQQAELSNLTLKFNSVNDVMTLEVKTGLFEGSMSQNLFVDARNNRDLQVKSVLQISGVQVGKLFAAFKSYIPDANALVIECKKLDKSLSGKVNVRSNLVSRGGTMNQIMNAMNGRIELQFADGTIGKGKFMEKIAGAVEKFFPLGDMKFRDMSVNATIKDGRVIFDQMSIASPLVGDWGVKGSAGLNGTLDLNVSTRLTPLLSRPIVLAQNAGKNAANNVIQAGAQQIGGQIGAVAGQTASNYLAGAGIPVDKEGRVTTLLGIGGLASGPVPKFLGFGGENAAPQQQQPTPAQPVKQLIEEKKQEVQQQVQQKVEQATQQVEQQVEKKAEEKLGKTGADAAKNAAKKLKGLLR